MAFEEVLLSSTQRYPTIKRQLDAGKLRKIAPMLYTRNLVDSPEAIVKRNVWQIVAMYCPGAIITDRTGIEGRPAADGSVFVVHDRRSDVELPGLRIRPREGRPATDHDRMFMGTLRMASPGRALLENLVPSRARSGVSRTLKRDEIEAHLEKILARSGPGGLNQIRDDAREVASMLGHEAEMRVLENLIGSLLGTREDPAITAPAALARLAGRPYDRLRLELFEALRVELVEQAPALCRQPPLDRAGHDNLAFFEAYFSNFIEGTEFEVEEAYDIVFNSVIPTERPADAHDVLGTFRIASNGAEMRRTPGSLEEFLDLLRARHAVIMEQRPEKGPGQFKTRVNRFGALEFVAPDLIVGTLERGFEMYRSLSDPFARAAFIAYVVSEVHPFSDGNGRTARIMMNAELVAAGEQRIIIPTVYRDNYLAALRALSVNKVANAYVRMLSFAQDYTRLIPWNSFEQAKRILTATNAFLRAAEAEEEGLRLRKPSQNLLQEVEDAAFSRR